MRVICSVSTAFLFVIPLTVYPHVFIISSVSDSFSSLPSHMHLLARSLLFLSNFLHCFTFCIHLPLSVSESHSILFSPLKLLPSTIHLLLRPLSILFCFFWHDWLLKLGWLSTASPAKYPLQPQLCQPSIPQPPRALITLHCKEIISGRDQILKHDESVLVFKWSWSCWFLIRVAEDA